MSKFLLFTIYAPMCAWGDMMCGDHRKTSDRPGKSHVVGMIAAGMGLDRSDSKILEISSSLGFSVRVDAEPILMQDFQTIRVPRSYVGHSFVSRQDELRNLDENLVGSEVSWRDYCVDSAYTVALWVKGGPEGLLSEIRDALILPKGLIYMGRKNCLPGAPFLPKIVEADGLVEAYKNVAASGMLHPERVLNSPRYYWEGKWSGLKASYSVRRRDEIIALEPVRYGVRVESVAS